MKLNHRLLLAAALSWMLGTTTHADMLFLDFSADGLTTGFNVVEGQTIEIPIFLRQTGPGPFNPDLTSDALVTFGVRADLTAGPGSSTITGSSISSPFIDLLNLSTSAPTFAQIYGDDLTGSATGSAIEIARITVMGNSASNVTTLTLSDPVPGGFEDFGTLVFGGIDSQVFSTTPSISITTVPEPTSFALLGLGGLAVLLLQLQHRRTLCE